MAVSLTPRFRRLTSSSSVRGRRHPGYSEPFHATQLWNNIIHALHTQVDLRQQRLHWRMHGDCFTGADAVDVVLSYLMQNVYFSNNDISRLKAARLCQALMDHRVFYPVGTRLFSKERENLFEDRSSSLYKFVDSYTLPGAGKDQEIENLLCYKRLVSKRKFPKPVKLAFSNPVALEACDKRIEELFHTINLRPSLRPNLKVKSRTSYLTKKVVEDVWKQTTLLQLLHLIHLPILDNILESPMKAKRRRLVQFNQKIDLVISNTFLDREVSQSLNLPYTDKWFSVAVDCLEYFPDEVIVHTSELLSQIANDREAAEKYKRVLFETIVKHYIQNKEPLLCDRYRDIYAGIIELLESGKPGQALEAAQLCIRLLEPNWREELHRLLSFMAVAGTPDACILQKQNTNRTVIRKTFTKAIVQSKSLTKTQAEELVIFLMDNHTELFKIPSSLLRMVRKKLLFLQGGGDPNTSSGFTFCQHVTQKEFEEQKDKTTMDQLKQLVQEISQNSNTSAKERNRLLEEFQKQHPSVFVQRYSNII
ncbi:DEP domain-containing protein 4 isoform X1 [Hemiscyllium ocellatum]|uniref:DEP domain-containing protein 4 isoform X1 n=2 Tax=Hemiscyllium ocellatum TaxID=170820 RepID=UPI0029670355|nr:DEP domain-containing protein 4 isoform X1 [Hemiscyllium ocellatum]